LPEEVDTSKVSDHLNRFWKGEKTCPICRTNNWLLEKQYGSLPVFDRQKPFYMAGPVYPLAVITCKTCGYTFYLNAMIAGFLKPPELPQATASAPVKVEDKKS